MSRIHLSILSFVAILFSTAAGNESRLLWRPQISLSAAGGGSHSYVKATGQNALFFKPVGEIEKYRGLTIKIDGAFHFNRFVSIGTGIWYERRGQSTTKAAVTFNNDEFIHDMSTRTRFVYISVPLLISAGYQGRNHWASIVAGPVGSITTRDSTLWIVDDRIIDPNAANVPKMPKPRTNTTLSRLTLGVEYGVKLGDNGLFINGNFEKYLSDFVHFSNITGSARWQAYSLTLGYRRFFNMI